MSFYFVDKPKACLHYNTNAENMIRFKQEMTSNLFHKLLGVNIAELLILKYGWKGDRETCYSI